MNYNIMMDSNFNIISVSGIKINKIKNYSAHMNDLTYLA